MFSTLLPGLCSKRIILASQSPRRKEILQKLGLPFEVVVSDFEENLNKEDFIGRLDEYPVVNAYEKALDVFRKQIAANKPVDLIIGCDTVVIGGQPLRIIEKPSDRLNAVQILRELVHSGLECSFCLSGRSHRVVSGVALVWGDSKNSCAKFHEVTEVTFGDVSDALIQAYVDTGEPMDKAGAYGIQGYGGVLVQGIVGDYYNVMGLPLHALANKLVSIAEELK